MKAGSVSPTETEKDRENDRQDFDRTTPVGEEQAKEQQVRDRFALEYLDEGEEIKYVLQTDMNLDGEYDEGWLIATDRRLFVFPAFPELAKVSQRRLTPRLVPRLPQSEQGRTNYEEAEEKQSWQPQLVLDYNEIEALETEHFVGNGLLSARTKERTIELARFSLAKTIDIDELVIEVNTILEKKRRGRVSEEAVKERDRAKRRRQQAEYARSRCPKCGGVMQHGVCPNCLNKRDLFRRVLRYVVPYKWQAFGLLATTAALAALHLLPPVLTKFLVDDAIANKNMELFWIIIATIVVMHFMDGFITGVRTYISTWLGQRVVADLRNEVYQHLQRLSMSYYDRNRTGAIMSRITNDTSRLQRFTVDSVQSLLMNIFMVIGIGVSLVLFNWKLALYALLPTPIIIIATAIFIRRIHTVYHRIWIRVALMNSVLADTIPGIMVVKAFTKEEDEIGRFSKRSTAVFNEWVTAGKFRSIFSPVILFVTNLGTIFVWAYGGYLVITDQGLTLGTLMAFLGFMGRFYQPVRELSNFSNVVQEAATSAERVFEILDTEPEVKPDDGNKIRLTKLRGDIEYDDVTFAYETGEEVLKNVSVKIDAGEMVGLVGSSGSGKTTFVNLIPRLYDVTDGAVRIDGYDVRDLDLTALRSQIGIVLQEPLLFHGSIAENIAYGRPGASRREIIEAAEAANAHDFIMEFPDGYDTLVGERGVNLSGGQKQRISIARAILKNPRILILDEATSSVDTETEKLIQEAINRLVKNRTTLAIAHRLSTLQNADRILVIEDGRLVEQGTHDELMAQNGVFAKLVRLQSEIAKTRAV